MNRTPHPRPLRYGGHHPEADPSERSESLEAADAWGHPGGGVWRLREMGVAAAAVKETERATKDPDRRQVRVGVSRCAGDNSVVVGHPVQAHHVDIAWSQILRSHSNLSDCVAFSTTDVTSWNPL